MSLKQRVARLEKDDIISKDIQWLKNKYFELDDKIKAISYYLDVELKKANYIAESIEGGDD